MATRRKASTARRRSSASQEGAAPISHAPRSRAKPRTSVGLKIILTTSSVVAISMVVFSYFLYQKFAAALSAEVDETGVLAVSALAATDVDAWRLYDGTALEWRRGMASLESGRAPEEETEVLWGSPAEKAAAQLRREANEKRVQRFAQVKGVKVLDAVILDATKSKVFNGEAIAIPSADDRTHPSGVLIREARYKRKDSGSAQPARIYQKPLLDEHGEVAGWAILALSLVEIEGRLARIRQGGILLTVVFIGVGLLASWWVSQRITRPLQMLAEDIDIVSRGDLGHRTVAQTEDEVGVLARAFDEMTANLFEAQELGLKAAAHDHQIEIAHQVQAALFPPELPRMEGYDSAAEARAADKVGGTWYDLIPRPDGSQIAVVASASSGGVPGAMIAAMARSSIQGVAEHRSSPAEILRAVNRLLAADLRRGMYVTVLMVHVDPEQHVATVANAGHHPLLICRPGASSAEALHSEGIALGFDKGPVFERTLQDVRVDIPESGRLVLCTRSLFQVAPKKGKEIGEAPVYRAMAAHAAKNSAAFVAMVMNGLQRHADGAEPREDLALLTLKRVGAPPPPPPPPTA